MELHHIIFFLCTSQDIPYMGPIYGSLREGMSINILGTAHEDMDRYEQERCVSVRGNTISRTSPQSVVVFMNA